MNEAVTEIFDRHARLQRNTMGAIDTIIAALDEPDQEVVLDWLRKSKNEFGHAAAARALTDLALTFPGGYSGPTQIKGSAVANWRERH